MAPTDSRIPEKHAAQQGAASSSEVIAPTLQSRRGPRAETPRPSLTSWTTPNIEDAGHRQIGGLDSIAENMVSNKNGRIVANHTRETLASAWFLSREVSKVSEEIDEIREDNPRTNQLLWKRVRILQTYHSLLSDFNATTSLPKPQEKHIVSLQKLGSKNLSLAFRGEKGNWLSFQDLTDFSHLTGSEPPYKTWAHSLFQKDLAILKIASQTDPLELRPGYPWWLDSGLQFVVENALRLLMLAGMIIPLTAKKLWVLSPEQQVAVHIVSVLVINAVVGLMGQPLDSQMLLTMTLASINAEILSAN